MSYLETYTGTKFYPFEPVPEEVHIEDIAHSLALQCRYNGHCNTFYSVAQHSVISSLNVSQENALWALLHDGSEAYLTDLPRPVKHHPNMTAYRDVERLVQDTICTRFGLPLEMPKEVKVIDDRMISTEIRDILSLAEVWEGFDDPLEEKIVPWNWETAEKMFLERFKELYEGD